MPHRFFIPLFLMMLFVSNCAEANNEFIEDLEITVFCLKDVEQIIQLELEDDGKVSESNRADANYLFKVCESWVVSDFQKYQNFFSNDPKVTDAIYGLYTLHENVASLLNNSRVRWTNFKLSPEERKHPVIPAVEEIKQRRQREIEHGAGVAFAELFTE